MKREPFRLGEYGPPEPALQGLFFRTLFEVEPRCFSTLLALLPDCPAGAAIGDAEQAPVIAKIKRWGGDWHLTDAWCVDGALALLLILSHYGNSAAQLFDISPTADVAPLASGDIPMLDKHFAQMALMGDLPPFLASITFPPSPAPFAFVHSGWDVTISTRRSFETDAHAGFDKALREYCEGLEAVARAQGFDKIPEKRNPEHYRWLARYQVKGERPADIWRSLLRNRKRPQKDELKRDAVEKAIRDIAREIGLTRRRLK